MRLGLIDQAVSALSNVATIVMAGLLLPTKAESGAMMLAVTVAMFAVNTNRAFIGDILLVAGGDDEGGERRLVERAASTGLTVAACAAVILAAIWWAAPASTGLTDVIWIVPALPGLLLQDIGRYAALAEARPGTALLLDAVWLTVQTLITAVVLVTGHASSRALLIAWGAGAAAGAIVWLAKDGIRARLANPCRWWSTTRHLSGWFTASSLLGQIQVQVIAFSVATVLGVQQFAQLRLLQTVVLSPAQNAGMAANGQLVPRFARLYARGDVAGVHRLVRYATAVLGAAGLVGFVVAVVAGGPVVRAVAPEYAAAIPLITPLGLQAVAYILQVPLLTALRGLRRARDVFAQSALYCVVSIVGVVFGSFHMGLAGAAWGLCAGMVVAYLITAARFYASVRKGVEAGL